MTLNPARTAHPHLTRLLEDLGVTSTLESGTASLVFDDNIGLNLTTNDLGTVHLSSPLPQDDTSPSPALIRGLLEANSMRHGSARAVFGLVDGIPVLMGTIKPSLLTYSEFRQVIEDFVNTAAACTASPETLASNEHAYAAAL
ncbi:MAG: type III secretion system chaperone [Verrucomicrobium sp.]|nr:type III secretion system chaperone [Verrucomicrobium sp.]